MKQLILFMVLMFSASCVQNTIHSQQELTTTQEVPIPSVAPTPFTFPKLSDFTRLNERLPKKVRRVLEQAEELELFEIEICMEGFSPKLEQVESDKFQGCRIKRKATITDANLKQQLLDGLFYAVGSSDSGAGCFSPRHGLRAIHKGKRVDLVICFQCSNFRGTSTGLWRVGGGMSSEPKELFEKVLANTREG